MKKNLNIFLSYPRCGNHYIWGKFIEQNNLQCLYDLDIIPALHVLSNYCDEKLDFLNFNNKKKINTKIFPLKYNFQYDSLVRNPKRFKSNSAKEHLDYLYKLYKIKDRKIENLCKKLFHLQDGNKDFFIINRFVYSFYYDQKTIFENKFSWTVNHSIESLELMDKLLRNYYNINYFLLTREVNDWIRARQNHFSYDKDEVKNYVNSIKIIKDSKLNVKILDFKKVIKSFKSNDDILKNIDKFLVNDLSDYLRISKNKINSEIKKIPLINFKKLFKFIFEKNFFEKQSLVYSVGRIPQNKNLNFLLFPLNIIINKSKDKNFLNNAKIKKL